MNTTARRKQLLLARNAELRAALASDLAAVRADLAPVAYWLERTQLAAAWMRRHAPLLVAASALLGTLMLSRRRTADPAGRESPSRRLWRLLRVAISVAGLVSRFADRGPRGAA